MANKDLWLRPTRGSSTKLVNVAEDEILAARASGNTGPVILNCMFHNVEVIPGASRYAQSETEASAILKRTSDLLAFAASENIETIGLADAAEIVAGSAS